MPLPAPRPLLSLPVLGALALLAPGLAPTVAGAEAPAAVDVGPLVAGHNAFACELYGRLASAAGTTGNVLVSPYSVHTALAMTRAGARGETAAQMDRVLRLPASGVPEAWRALVQTVSTPPAVRERGEPADTSNTVYSLSVANRLFGQRGYPFVPDFRRLLETSYGAGLEDADFRDVETTRRRINDWVLSKTNDKIRDLIPAGLPSPDTRLALVNAIHLLAQWDEPFYEAATQDREFTNGNGERVKVRMMRRTAHWRFAEDEAVRVLTLRYREGALEMLVVLPKRADGLAEAERALTPEALERWAQGKRHEKVALELPKFRFEAATELSATLTAMGMAAPFSAASADFRGMADVPGEPLFVGAVLHKAFIAVDEKGTEAAAATAVLLRAGSAPRPDEPIPFVCDRPFLFLLRHRATGALLFAGRLAAPR